MHKVSEYKKRADEYRTRARKLESWTSVLLSEALILRSYNVLSIPPFQPTHREMTLCGLLEVFDKQIVH